MLKFLIADDHEIVRRGVKQILGEAFPQASIEEAVDTYSLISKANLTNWDVIVSDLAMPGGGGLTALREIHRGKPEVPVIILSIYPEDQYAATVLKEGAAGYLNKDAAPDQLVTLVKSLVSGDENRIGAFAVKPKHVHHSLTGLPHLQLSEREMMVLRMIGSGKTITKIAEELKLGLTTVSTYRSRILSKMNLRSNRDLVNYTAENQLL
jgi:two-component system invasion response regulator UvrY